MSRQAWGAKAAFALVVLAATGALFFLVLPGLRVLSMDFRAMARIFSMLHYPPVVVDPDWVALGDFALRVGVFPLLALVVFAGLLRLRARWRPGAWTLGLGGPWLKRAVAVGTFVPLAGFSVPFSVAIAGWTTVESRWVLEWPGFDLLDDLWDMLRIVCLGIFGPATLLAGTWIIRKVLRRPEPRPERSRRRRLVGYVALALVAAAAVPFSLQPLGLVVAHAGRVLPVLGKAALFEHRCGACHHTTVPLSSVKTPDQWRYLLDETGMAARAKLTAEEYDDVTDFLLGMRSYPDAWIFVTRCQRCHLTSAATWDDRHPDDWAMIVDRVARYSPDYFQGPFRLQLERHLAKEHGDEEEGPGIRGEAYRQARRVIRRCGDCHYLSRNVQLARGLSEEEVVALVRRMSARMSPPIPEDEVPIVARTYRETIADPETLKRLVPHVRPALPGKETP